MLHWKARLMYALIVGTLVGTSILNACIRGWTWRH